MTQWSDFQCLNPSIVHALTSNDLFKPTRVQQEVFDHYPHYYDFLVAAQTGSGKTLAFAAPILSELERMRQLIGMPCIPQCILGLVLTPTHELAQQIEGNILMALATVNQGKDPREQIKVACIIGGMSKEKQLRVLRQKKPQIIIGTPGRLHELLGENALNFSHLKYLVVDEADRMIEMGHFKEIDEILEHIFEPKMKQFFDKDYMEASTMLAEKSALEQQHYFVKENGKRVKINMGLNSVPTDQCFQIPISMISFADPQYQPKPQQKKKKKEADKEKKTKEIQFSSEDKIFLNKLKRRIFFISATLTRQFKGSRYFIKKPRTEEEWDQTKKDRKLKRKEKEKALLKKGKKVDKKEEKRQQSIEETIPKLKALISRAKFSDKPKIIDQSSLLFLPEGLKQVLTFTDGDEERMAHIVCYIKELPAGSKAIIFANTIKGCKRIQFYVQSFKMTTLSLHSHMQQKQRLKKLQKFKKSTLCNILIATDVAARGLDFQISHVIQMGVPVNGDTYVHRAGRTARAARTGQALILVDKKEVNRWTDINDTISETTPDRRVHKYMPIEKLYNDTFERVKQFDWIRRNQEKKEERFNRNDKIDADDLGMEVEDQAPRKKYDLDREEEAIVRHEVKKKTERIRNAPMKVEPVNENSKWKKNKLVLSLDDIKRML